MGREGDSCVVCLLYNTLESTIRLFHIMLKYDLLCHSLVLLNVAYYATDPTSFLRPAMTHTSSRIYSPFGHYLHCAHCNALKCSFLHTVISVWNGLPHHGVVAESFSMYHRVIIITAIYQ